MVSKKSVLNIIESHEYIGMETELEESLNQRKTIEGRIRLKIEKIKEKRKPKRWASKKTKNKTLNQHRIARITFNSEPPHPNVATTENVKIFQNSVNFIAMFGKPTGFNVSYEWSWKTNLLFWYTIFLITFSWFHFLYTQYLSINNGEHTKIFEVFAIYGIGVSCVIKSVCFLKYYKEMNALYNSIFKLCRDNGAGRRATNLKFLLLNNFTFYKLVTFLSTFCIFGFVAYTMKALIIDRQLISLLPIEIMFVDKSTDSGFFIANICMAAMGIYAFFLTLYMGLIFVCTVRNYCTQVCIIEEDVKDLDEMWSGKSATTVAYRHMFLRNICRKYQDMNEYINIIKKIFDISNFLYFSVSYLSQIICLYEIRINNWIPGYGIAVGLFNEMIFYCLMGTQLTIDHDRLFYILTQSNWYTYDLDSQKKYLLLLHFSMNASELWIGPLAPLNVYTASVIIYPYYTVMKEVI